MPSNLASVVQIQYRNFQHCSQIDIGTKNLENENESHKGKVLCERAS